MADQKKKVRPRPRKIRRHRISAWENLAGVLILAVLALVAFWFASKKDDFDPEERDIPLAVLQESAAEDNLYRTPLKPWREPGTVPAAGGTAEAAAPDLGLFPDAILSGGWVPDSRLQEFSPDTLYEKIDGAADQYLQFGFHRLHYISLRQPETEAEVAIELYDMATFPNALGIFASQRNAERQVKGYGPIQYYITEAGAIAFFGNFYLKTYGAEMTDAIREKAMQIVRSLAPLAGDNAETPLPFTILTTDLGFDLPEIGYEKENAFQYSFTKDFWYGTWDEESGFRSYLHHCADSAEAESLFGKLLENHLYDYTLESETPDHVVLKHKFLENFLTLDRAGSFIYGVENAPDIATAKERLEKVAVAVSEYADTGGPDAADEAAGESTAESTAETKTDGDPYAEEY